MNEENLKRLLSDLESDLAQANLEFAELELERDCYEHMLKHFVNLYNTNADKQRFYELCQETIMMLQKEAPNNVAHTVTD